jgi:membrane protease YdiL (CAAX protease family)
LSSPENPRLNPQALNGEPETPLRLIADSFPPPEIQLGSPAPRAGENPVWSGWDVLVIAVLTVVSVVLLGAVLALGTHLVYPQTSLKDVSPLLAILAQLLAYVAVAVYMVLMVEGKYHVRFWQAIGWNWPQSSTLKLLGLGVFTVSLDLLSRYLPMPKNTPFEEFFARPRDAYLLVLFAVTLGPLMEELFFRGFLYPVLARRLGVVGGVLLTALPFGLIHYVQYRSWSAVLVVGLVGVVLTVVRVVTKSVAASFLVHVGYNGTLMLLAAWATDGFRHMDKAAVLRF